MGENPPSPLLHASGQNLPLFLLISHLPVLVDENLGVLYLNPQKT